MQVVYAAGVPQANARLQHWRQMPTMQQYFYYYYYGYYCYFISILVITINFVVIIC